MGLKEIFIGVIIVTIFALSILTFGSNLLINNNAEQNLIDDPALSGLNESLSEYLGGIQDTAQTQREATESQEAQGGSADEGFGLTAIVGALFTFFGTAISSLNLLFVVISDVIGIPPLILNVILGLFIIALIIYIWRTIKVGGT